jgi:hypothetical protein
LLILGSFLLLQIHDVVPIATHFNNVNKKDDQNVFLSAQKEFAIGRFWTIYCGCCKYTAEASAPE